MFRSSNASPGTTEETAATPSAVRQRRPDVDDDGAARAEKCCSRLDGAVRVGRAVVADENRCVVHLESSSWVSIRAFAVRDPARQEPGSEDAAALMAFVGLLESK